MKTMPCVVRKNHYKYIQKIVHCQDKCFVNMEEFFSYLDMYCCNCFEYKLLEEVIVSSKCSQALCNQMHNYVQDVQAFRQRTEFSMFFCHERFEQGNTNKGLIPPQFEQLTSKHRVDPNVCTLAAMDTFRTETCSLMEVSEYALLNIKSKQGSVVVEWMFPVELKSVLTSLFCGKIGQRLLQTHKVEFISINGELLCTCSVSVTHKPI